MHNVLIIHTNTFTGRIKMVKKQQVAETQHLFWIREDPVHDTKFLAQFWLYCRSTKCDWLFKPQTYMYTIQNLGAKYWQHFVNAATKLTFYYLNRTHTKGFNSFKCPRYWLSSSKISNSVKLVIYDHLSFVTIIWRTTECSLLRYNEPVFCNHLSLTTKITGAREWS